MADLPDFDSLWDFEHPAESEARLRALLPKIEASGDRAYWAGLLTQVARAQGLQGYFEAGHQTLDQAQRILPDGAKQPQIRLALERGRLRNSAGDRAAAKPEFQLAWKEARAAGEDGLAVDAAHMLAIVAEGDAAMEWNRMALALAESSADPRARRWRASIYNNLGWTYHDRGEFAAALDCFEKGVALREEAGIEPELRIARWCVARALRSLGRVQEALEGQRALKAQLDKEGAESDGFVEEEIGECLLALQRAGEARSYFAAAFRLLSNDPGLARDEPERLARLKELGQPSPGVGD